MLSYAISAKLYSWKETSESFILKCHDQPRVHGSLAKTDRHLLDDQQKTLFENTVKYNSESRAVKDQADQMHAQKVEN